MLQREIYRTRLARLVLEASQVSIPFGDAARFVARSLEGAGLPKLFFCGRKASTLRHRWKA